MKKSNKGSSNGVHKVDQASRPVGGNGRWEAMVRKLKLDLRRERSANKALRKECSEYRQALLEQFKRTCKPEDWRDVNEEDFKYSLADILSEWKQNRGE